MRRLNMSHEKIKVGKDIIINIFASSVCTAVLNLVVYPLFARLFSSEDYGMILTALGVINILYSGIGNTLNNVRLLKNRKAGANNKNNPYNLLLIISSIIGTALGTGIIYYIYPLPFVAFILIVATLFIGILRAYYIVEFRLKINYVRQLISNVIVAIGYLVGAILIRKVDFWPLPFLLGELLSLIYASNGNDLFHEGVFGKNDKDGITKAFITLVLCNILANMLVYLDRFIINPILGATFVAIFSVASFWGKCFSPFIAPTATVILSYLSKEGTEISLRRYKSMFIVTLVPIAFLIISGIWIAPFITELLYPTLIGDARSYILLASTGALIGCATSLLMPMIMSVCSMKDLFVIQSIQFVVYIIFAYVGASIDGLKGFCYAILLINIIKVAMNYCFGWYRIKEHEGSA